MKNSTTALFKSTCDACSKSKSKCDGGNPCSVCKKKGLSCKYAFRMKRGPKGSGDSGKRSKLSPRVMSSYERRLWSVFFTIFKNAKPSHAESKFVWCWYANQLNKLSHYFEQSGNERLVSLMEQFFRSLDIKKNELTKGITDSCPFSPHVCGGCSSLTIVPQKAPKLSPSHVVSSFTSAFFRREFERNEKPCLVYYAGDGADHQCEELGFSVNSVFTEVFDYDAPKLNRMLHWSNGGFLPFGGDLLSAILVHESDVLLFLQIMSAKYQAARVPEVTGKDPNEETCWEVPSCHSFRCWYRNDENAELEIHLVNFYFIIHITKKGRRLLSTRMQLTVQDVRKLNESPSKGLVPISHEFPLVAQPKLETKFEEAIQTDPTTLDWAEPLCSTNCDVGEAATLEVDKLPEEYATHYNNWVTFQDVQPLGRTRSVELAATSDLADEDELSADSDWFQTLSQWALANDEE